MTAWSSRRSVVSWLAASATGLALGCERRTPTDRGPAFRIANVGSEHGARDGDAIWTAIACVGPQHRDATLALLRQVLDEVEAEATPGLSGLFERQASELIHKQRGRLLPKLTAARSLIRDRWSDGQLSVAPGAAGEGLRFWPWSRDDDVRTRRARLLIWPITHAARVRGLSTALSERVVDALADRSDSADSLLALALPQDVAERREAPAALTRLCADCRRLNKLVARAAKDRPMLKVLADLGTVTDRSLLSWYSAAPGEVLVVPRLGALARRREWLDELRAALAKSGAGAADVVEPG